MDTPDIEAAKDKLRTGAESLAKGRTADAEAAFQAALALAPGYAPANHNLGLIRLRRGDAALALPYLEDAARAMPSGTTFLALAECYEALGQPERAIEYYKPVLEQTDQTAETWTNYAQLLEGCGRKEEAAAAYRAALSRDPGNVTAAIKLSWMVWRTDHQQAIDLLEKCLSEAGENAASRIKVLGALILFKEWKARIDADRPPYHASSMNELFFSAAANLLADFQRACETVLEGAPTDHWARMNLGLAYFASEDRESAQQCFHAVGEATGNVMAKSVRFDAAFFDTLQSVSDADLLDGLPPVETARSVSFADNDILYMACNSTYFDAFAKPLLRSLADKGPESQVHVHLMDSAPDHTATVTDFCDSLAPLRIAVSVERPDLSKADIVTARAYFHAIRFIRFYHHLQIYGKTLWLMDVDGLFNLPPATFFSSARDCDVAMRVRPGRLEPWNQFNACLFGVAPTERGLTYLHAAAAYIAHFYRLGPMAWGIDQLAMYAAYIDLERRGAAPTVHFLDEKVLDYDYRDDGVLWCSSGVTKFAALNAKNAGTDPTASPYDRAFARYAGNDPRA